MRLANYTFTEYFMLSTTLHVAKSSHAPVPLYSTRTIPFLFVKPVDAHDGYTSAVSHPVPKKHIAGAAIANQPDRCLAGWDVAGTWMA